MSKLLLVRHGRTRLHSDDRFWGKTDIPLSSIGIKQAGQLRVRLAHEKIKVIYSSPLSRARYTAEIIAAEHKLSVNVCDELAECNFGYIEGLTFDEIKRLYPELAEELASRKAVNFPGGESLEQLNDRVRVFLHKLENSKPQDTVVIVAHGGPLRLIICNLLDIDIKYWVQLGADLASLSIVNTFPGISYLNLLNDTSHLKA
jgi:broad specificity phosphatase PhoE